MIPIPELATFAGAVSFLVILILILALLRTLSQDDLDSIKRYFAPTPFLSRLLEFGLGYY